MLDSTLFKIKLSTIFPKRHESLPSRLDAESMLPMTVPKPGYEAADRQEAALERLILRLGIRLEKLNQVDKRYSFLRLVVFCLGVLAVYLVSATTDTSATWLATAVSVSLFFATVALHRRLDRWRVKFSLWQKMRQGQLSRIRLEWSALPDSPVWWAAPDRPALLIDLDLTGPRSLHRLLDLAVSQEGSRRLADWLSQDSPDLEQLPLRQKLVRELRSMHRFRDRLLLNLHLVSTQQMKGENLLKWLESDVPGGNFSRLLFISIVMVLANLVLFVLGTQGILGGAWVFSGLVYIAFLSLNAGRLRPFLESISAMDAELDKFASLLKYLEKSDYNRAPDLGRLCAPFYDPANLPSRLLSRVKWVTAMVGLRSNAVAWLIINLVLPWDFLCAALAASLRTRAKRLFPLWLETWYQLEALCSLANFATLNPHFAFPNIQSGAQPAFSARELGHPLIPRHQRICNDFEIQSPGDVIVITGSNMAGKSTFLKAVGVNLCLAYSGGPVCATLLDSLPLRLHTCIRISDSISDGFSYFYAEVKCLKHLLETLQASDSQPVLYLIDEIFRGTNNRERLLGSQAYVRTLVGANGCGLIATHDLELARLEQESAQVINCHFQDAVQDGKLVFDYRIRSGASPTTNALKIMRMEGLPVPPESTA